MSFKLHSPFKPTGDQPQAIRKLAAGLKLGLKHQTLLGVTGSGKTFTMANVVAKINKPTLIISHNKTLAAQLAEELSEFFPENAVHYFVSYYDYYQPEAYIPQSDTYIEKETSINEEIDRLRHAATQSLLTRHDVIIIASVSCIYGLGSPKEYQKETIELKVNQKISIQEISRYLVSMQYKRNDFDIGRGTFCIKGEIIDIHQPYSLDEITRLEFFGQTIEKISLINFLTGKKITDKKEMMIFPATHYLAPSGKFKWVLNQIRTDMISQVKKFKKQNKLLEAQRLQERTLYDLEMIENTGYCNGIENYSRYFDSRIEGEPPYTLLDFFNYPRKSMLSSTSDPRSQNKQNKQNSIKKLPISNYNFLTFIDESHMTIPQIKGMYTGDKSRKQTLIDYGFRLEAARDNRPLNFKEFNSHTSQVVYVSATPGEYEISQSRTSIQQISGAGKDAGAQLFDNASLGWAQVMKPAPTKNKQNFTGVIEQLIRPTGLLDPTIEIKPSKNQIDDLINQIQKRIKKGQRILITTLTKRMAEDLAEYLQDINIKAYYLHSEINTFKRIEILQNLRLGKYDVIVGINLLREGLDLPEVALIAILDADKEGYLRSDTALIQTMGRAARHIDGHIIMYADKITGSMKRAISETTRRRKIQMDYNKKHNITPKTIQKEIKELKFKLETDKISADKNKQDLRFDQIKKLSPQTKGKLIQELTTQMELSAENLNFEKAAELRDKIKKLKD